MGDFPYKSPVRHSMLRRCNGFDYCAPQIYMVTLTLEDRSKPLLGKVVPIVPHGVGFRPELVQADFEPSPLGMAILDHWKNFPMYVPEIRPLYLQLMEEHLHALLHVWQRMRRPLGNAIGGFKTWCNKFYREMTGNPSAQLFSAGFHDSILLREGQLSRMINYMSDNPRRHAIKRLFPVFFTVLRNLSFARSDFMGIGNSFLLDGYSFHQIQASRSITPEELEEKRQSMFQAIAGGGIVVSPCISDGEKTLAREAFSVGAPLVALRDNGFRPMYKPSGRYFEACASGKLLMLSPKEWGYTAGRPPMTREKALALNSLASKIAGQGACEIHYRGMVPSDLGSLLGASLF